MYDPVIAVWILVDWKVKESKLWGKLLKKSKIYEGLYIQLIIIP